MVEMPHIFLVMVPWLCGCGLSVNAMTHFTLDAKDAEVKRL